MRKVGLSHCTSGSYLLPTISAVLHSLHRPREREAPVGKHRHILYATQHYWCVVLQDMYVCMYVCILGK